MLPPIEVVGVVIRRAFATIGSLMWGGIWVGIGSSSSGDPQLPPQSPEPTPCNTGELAIDEHEDFFNEVWEARGYDEGVPIENGGFAIPNEDGGYHYFWFGSDIPAALGACSIALRTGWQDALPASGEWPEGSVFIHSHPFAPYADQGCADTPARGGASDTDRNTVRNFEQWFDVSLDMVILDPVNIYHYEHPDESDEDARETKCGY